MIQEVVNGVADENKTSNSTNSEPQQNLRCPRCDSSNTKFCYYNNYNLTQPRHFCKTCRRYWTKGGALRNVPIGGGCRKAKSVPPSIAAAANNNIGSKFGYNMTAKPADHDNIIGRFGQLAQGLDQQGALPAVWGGMPHGSHLLALLRASTQMQNLNQNPNISNMVGAFNWKNENHLQYQQHPLQQQNLLSDVPTTSGIQELYQRLRLSTGSYCNNDYLQVINANINVASTSAATTTMATTINSPSILDPVPLSAVDLGYWNSNMSWSDLNFGN